MIGKPTPVEKSGEGLCFACGKNNEHGLQLSFEQDRDAREARCTTMLADGFSGYPGVAHGGITATILDEAMVYACRAAGKSVASATITIKYRQMVPTGETFQVRGMVLSAKSRRIKTKAVIEKDGVVLAEAEGLMLVVDDLA